MAVPDWRRGHAPARDLRGRPRIRRRDGAAPRGQARGPLERNPAYAQVLRAYHRATHEGDFATAQGLLAWLAGQPHTDRSVFKAAGTKGKVDGQASLTFLAGLLQLLRQSGYDGLRGRARRGRDHPAHERADAREVAERAAAIDGHVREGGAARPVPGGHRHARLLRGVQGSEGAGAALPARASELRRRSAVRQPSRAAGAAASVHRGAAAHGRDAHPGSLPGEERRARCRARRRRVPERARLRR